MYHAHAMQSFTYCVMDIKSFIRKGIFLFHILSEWNCTVPIQNRDLSFINDNTDIIQNYMTKNMSQDKGRIRMNEMARLYYRNRMHKIICALS